MLDRGLRLVLMVTADRPRLTSGKRTSSTEDPFNTRCNKCTWKSALSKPVDRHKASKFPPTASISGKLVIAAILGFQVTIRPRLIDHKNGVWTAFKQFINFRGNSTRLPALTCPWLRAGPAHAPPIYPESRDNKLAKDTPRSAISGGSVPRLR